MNKEALRKRFMEVSQKLLETEDPEEESKLSAERTRLLETLKGMDISVAAAYASMVK